MGRFIDMVRVLRVTLFNIYQYIFVSLSKQRKNIRDCNGYIKFPTAIPYDVFVLSYMSDVEIQNKALEITFSIIYKTSAKYQPVVFPEISCIISRILHFKCKQVSHWLTEFYTHISRFTVVRPL